MCNGHTQSWPNFSVRVISRCIYMARSGFIDFCYGTLGFFGGSTGSFCGKHRLLAISRDTFTWQGLDLQGSFTESQASLAEI